MPSRSWTYFAICPTSSVPQANARRAGICRQAIERGEIRFIDLEPARERRLDDNEAHGDAFCRGRVAARRYARSFHPPYPVSFAILAIRSLPNLRSPRSNIDNAA
jgi:hypothetical protein